MAPTLSFVNKLKVQLKLSISRLRMVQLKDSAKVKQQRRDMAQLLEAGKVQSARIRVENIIRSDITTELHEMLELYCELVLARSQLLDSQASPAPLDPALEEAVRSIIYAAPRTDIKELHTVRALLVDKFGKEVALASMQAEGVAERVVHKLRVETPSETLVEAYLSEIARFYGVAYGTSSTDSSAHADAAADVDEHRDDDDDDDDKGQDEREALAKANTPKKLGPQSPLRVVPPSPSTDNVAPRLKLPGAKDYVAKHEPSKESKSEPEKDSNSERGPGGKIPDVNELARRFAELKR